MSDPPPSDDRATALAFLYQRIDYERTPAVPYHARRLKLARMRELLDRLDNPHEGLKIVHVAGTKGKGSTAAMIAAVLRAAGYRIGLFTSPHLDRLEERFALDGTACSSGELVELVDAVRPAVAAMDARAAAGQSADGGPTFFEITTAMALVHFARRGVDAAVLEVGLGGRLDSTNVCRPAVSVITSISFDHVEQLGRTLAAIATEKAGIIKPGVPVVSGVDDDEPRDVIMDVCRRKGSPLVQLGRDLHYRYEAPESLDAADACGYVDVELLRGSRPDAAPQHYVGIPLGLVGAHQAANAAVAVATLAELRRHGLDAGERAIREGLRDVRWPGRVEVVARRPTVVVDAAHNVASVDALLEALAASFRPRRRVLLLATTQGKDVEQMLRRLLPRFDHVVLTQYSLNPRALPVAELESLAWRVASGAQIDPMWRVRENVPAAWEAATALAGEDDLICVAGSMFIAAEVRAHAASRPWSSLRAVPAPGA